MTPLQAGQGQLPGGLAQHTLDVELAFGLDAGQDRAIDGHCWLTLGGEPFLEKRDPRSQFPEIYRLPLRA